jgi:hypothetical protein
VVLGEEGLRAREGEWKAAGAEIRVESIHGGDGLGEGVHDA